MSTLLHIQMEILTRYIQWKKSAIFFFCGQQNCQLFRKMPKFPVIEAASRIKVKIFNIVNDLSY